MPWFKPKPMELRYGEPIHQMVARALLSDSIRPRNDFLLNIDFHFVGPHGIAYQGTKKGWKAEGAAKAIALLCEEIQQDFNERIAAMQAARELAISSESVPTLFKTVGREPTKCA